MTPQSSSPLSTALVRLGVSIQPATPQFREWCLERFPDWAFADVFFGCLPAAWCEVSTPEYMLCFLGDEATIQEASRRLDSSEVFRKAALLPIGALMDGSLLLMDTKDVQKMCVGPFCSDHLMSGDSKDLDPAHWTPFPLPYEEWLVHIQANPEDSRYL